MPEVLAMNRSPPGQQTDVDHEAGVTVLPVEVA